MKDSASFRETNPKLIEIPFNSKNKYQVSVHDLEKSGRFVLVMKGAPEIIFEKCSTILLEGKDVEINEEIKKSFEDANRHLGELGERVLGFCDLPLPEAKFTPGFQFNTDEEINFPITGLR